MTRSADSPPPSSGFFGARHEHEDRAAVLDEARDLTGLLAGLTELRPAIQQAAEDLLLSFTRHIEAEVDLYNAERRLDRFSREIRALWLRAVAAETAFILRSPTEKEVERLSFEHDAFGYERDLQPRELEERCDAFFRAVPDPWQAEHVLFSSGQAALVSVLLAFRSPCPLRVQHLGGYFETRQIVATCPSLAIPVNAAPDIVIAEPVACDGGFTHHSRAEIIAAAANAKALILDTTLLGRRDGIADLLGGLDRNLLVLRCASGLKLLQGGLELAQVGIVGVHARSGPALSEFTKSLREMRTLCGTGLRFADVLALDASFVFDPAYADHYARTIFANNASLAEHVAAQNRLFTSPFAADPSPYCVLALDEPTDGAYERLADLIASRARERRLASDQGGSFGFRGHRYELVRPEDGAPFLRIAMGHRSGWSARGVIELVAEISGLQSV